MSRHAIYQDSENPEHVAFDWEPRPWPGEQSDPDPLPAAAASTIPSGWSVVAVFEVPEPTNWDVGRVAVVAAGVADPSFRLMEPISERTYTPQDILAGNLPKGVTAVWTVPLDGPERMKT
ncbi:MAG: hypothetical protein F4X00_01205 [Gemmatimonadetes bacterium]|nr:hypothetical protein [Gemmatimonadota bacterium]